MKYLPTLCILLTAFCAVTGANDYYPLTTGNHWEYDAVEVDSTGSAVPGTEYQASSTMIGDSLVSGIVYQVMADSSNASGGWDISQLTCLRIVGDTLKMLTDGMDLGVFQETNLAILPGAIGMTWQAFQIDTFLVQMGETLYVSLDVNAEILDLGTCVVPAGSFDMTYHLRHNMHFVFWIGGFPVQFELAREYWMTPDVGPLKFYSLPSNVMGDPQPGELLELTDYDITAVEPHAEISLPGRITVQPAYPNPFNPATTIDYYLPVKSDVEVSLYRPDGRLGAHLLGQAESAGWHSLDIGGSHLPSGVYLLQVQAGDYRQVQRLVLMK